MLEMSVKAEITLRMLEWLNRLRIFFRRFRKAELSLIEEEDLMRLLRELGFWDDLLKQNLRCSQCEKTLTRDNLSGFFVRNGNYQFLCDSQTCLSARGRHD